MSKSLFLALLLASPLCAATVTDFGFTVGKITSPDPTNLVYEDIKATNPAVPLIFSPVSADTSGWSSNGDPISLSPIVITGFDLPAQKVTLSLDCDRYQYHHGPMASAITSCAITSITHEGSPSVFGTPVDFASHSIVLSEQGTLVDAGGFAEVDFFATGSGTGTETFIVSEPQVGVAVIAGFGLLACLAIYRSAQHLA
jgi:hypothetical protein